MNNTAALDITEIEEKQQRVMQGLTRLRDEDIEKHRKTFLRIASPSRTHLDSGDIGFFHARIKSADTVEEVRETLSTYFLRLINDEMHLRKQQNPLLNVLDYTSGDSWEGTHWRSIRIEIISGNHIRISNDYQGHVVDSVMDEQAFIAYYQDNALPYTSYYREFLAEAKANPETKALLERAEEKKNRPQKDALRLRKQQALRNHLRRR